MFLNTLTVWNKREESLKMLKLLKIENFKLKKLKIEKLKVLQLQRIKN